MVRFLAIILCFGLAIASGAAGYFAHIQAKQESEEVEAPTDFEMIDVSELIENTPGEDKAVELTDYFFGRLPIGINMDENKKDWEETYIPLFSKSQAVQAHNCICVIYQTDEIKSEEDQEAFFEHTTLQGFYVDSRELPDYAFSRLAQKYKSLDYSRCVLVSSKKPEQRDEPVYWMAMMGFAFFLSIAGWQSFALMGDMKTKIEREKRTPKVSDVAGLSSLFEQADASKAENSSSNATVNNAISSQSFLETWKPEE